MRLTSAVFRQQLCVDRVTECSAAAKINFAAVLWSYSKILPMDAIHLPKTISSSSNMRFVSTTTSPLLVPYSSG